MNHRICLRTLDRFRGSGSRRFAPVEVPPRSPSSSRDTRQRRPNSSEAQRGRRAGGRGRTCAKRPDSSGCAACCVPGQRRRVRAAARAEGGKFARSAAGGGGAVGQPPAEAARAPAAPVPKPSYVVSCGECDCGWSGIRRRGGPAPPTLSVPSSGPRPACQGRARAGMRPQMRLQAVGKAS